jgi:hypothetical protein
MEARRESVVTAIAFGVLALAAIMFVYLVYSHVTGR